MDTQVQISPRAQLLSFGQTRTCSLCNSVVLYDEQCGVLVSLVLHAELLDDFLVVLVLHAEPLDDLLKDGLVNCLDGLINRLLYAVPLHGVHLCAGLVSSRGNAARTKLASCFLLHFFFECIAKYDSSNKIQFSGYLVDLFSVMDSPRNDY